MKNCLILGSGRSGTSLVAGCLRKAGYAMGDDIMPPTESNPVGYFESVTVNRINEDLLTGVVMCPPDGPLGWFFPPRLVEDQRWLARVPVARAIPCPAGITDRIRAQVETSPYCLKDPRFSYTLPAWQPHLEDVVFVCVFREPGRTANSILADCERSEYLHNLRITRRWALQVWTLMYRHILEHHRCQGTWLFIHYDQVLEGSALDRLESALGATVDRGFPQASLRRSADNGRVPGRTRAVYKQLCAMADYTPPRKDA